MMAETIHSFYKRTGMDRQDFEKSFDDLCGEDKPFTKIVIGGHAYFCQNADYFGKYIRELYPTMPEKEIRKMIKANKLMALDDVLSMQ
jgi:hypothetical protein